MRSRGLVRLAIVGCVAAATVLATVPDATASMTVGQVAPFSSTAGDCTTGAPADFLQPTVTSTAGYFVKEAGTITSWSTTASLGPAQIYVMKIFRKVSDPAIYKVVGHDGPRTLTPSALNTFPANVEVEPGDILGFNEFGASACTFVVPGDSILKRSGDLSDGNSATFTTVPNLRLNISAVLVPTNSFTFAGVALNRANGTATLTLNVPNPGNVSIGGKGVSAASAGRKSAAKEVTVAGPVEMRIRARGTKRKTLGKSGAVSVKPTVTFTPFNGDPASQSTKVKLKLKRKH